MSERSKWDKKYRESQKGKLNSIKVKRTYQRTHKIETYVRRLTRGTNKKIGICLMCNEKIKTEFHHFSYEPNVFCELCEKCHLEFTNNPKLKVIFCREVKE